MTTSHPEAASVKDQSKGPKFAGKFVITDDIFDRSDCHTLQNKDLLDIEVMHANKYSVKALPTPDGNSILVFSSEITWTDNGFFGDSFELYDVDGNSWEVLPGFPSKRRPSSSILRIEGYGFETDSRFWIQMENEAFVLDLKASTKEWEVSPDFKIPLDDDGYFVGIGGVYFTPRLAYDIKDRGQIHYLPLSFFPYDASYGREVRKMDLIFGGRVYPDITSLGCKDGVYYIGVLHAQLHPPHMTTKNLHVILDIYPVDIDKYRRDKEEYKKRDKEEREEPALDNIGPKKTVKFMIDFDFYTYFTGLMYLFSV
ncbi:hypothetical protein ABFX02_07G110500 [Erythranthe guttata]